MTVRMHELKNNETESKMTEGVVRSHSLPTNLWPVCQNVHRTTNKWCNLFASLEKTIRVPLYSSHAQLKAGMSHVQVKEALTRMFTTKTECCRSTR